LYQLTEIAKIKTILTELFETGSLITFENLIKLVKYHYPDSDENNIKRYVYDTIERTISHRDVIADTFGYENYIQTDGINIFAQREYPQGNIFHQDSGYYTRHIIGTLQKNVDIAYRDLYLKKEDIYSQLRELKTIEDVREKYLDIVTDQRVRIDIFENAVINLINDTLEPFEKLLLEYYYLLLYRVKEPVRNLQRIKSYLTVKASGPGAKPTGTGKRTITSKTIDWSIQEPEDVPEYFVHIYHTDDGNKYTKNILFRPASMKVRILRNIHGTYRWSDLTEIEYYIYPVLICIQFEYRTREFRKRGIFGYVWDDDPNSIIFAENEPCISTGDTRRIRRGSVCSTKIPKDILIYFNPLKAKEIVIKTKLDNDMNDEDMIKLIEKSISKKELQHYNVDLETKTHDWLIKVCSVINGLRKRDYTKLSLCQTLQKSFEKANMIIRLPKI
jgi:hypothetical protein